MMKKGKNILGGISCAVLLLAGTGVTNAQQVYDNFSGKKTLYYTAKTGNLDTLAVNPAPCKLDSCGHCAKYVRNPEKKFDNIKMSINGKLTDVSNYATYTGVPPKIKMKVYTTAPVGTLVEVLLGSRKGNNDYPAGTHSQYQAYTTKSGEWEELEFKYAQTPKGSETAPTEVDQVTLLFNPNSTTADTYYFADLTGPNITSGNTAVNDQPVQNNKTPEKQKTTTVPGNKGNTKK